MGPPSERTLTPSELKLTIVPPPPSRSSGIRQLARRIGASALTANVWSIMPSRTQAMGEKWKMATQLMSASSGGPAAHAPDGDPRRAWYVSSTRAQPSLVARLVTQTSRLPFFTPLTAAAVAFLASSWAARSSAFLMSTASTRQPLPTSCSATCRPTPVAAPRTMAVLTSRLPGSDILHVQNSCSCNDLRGARWLGRSTCS
mmetsp:Transcript_31425/g.73124  ORF Transcript_31425/g.73124 Transcript_31425/m.73124 type:complete len:201 (-) Transcript_31425:5-607(-)